jgi:hypothetical protein
VPVVLVFFLPFGVSMALPSALKVNQKAFPPVLLIAVNGFPVPKVALISSGESTIAAAIAEIVPARRIIAAVVPLARMGRPFSKSDSLTIDLILVTAERATGWMR